MRGADQPRSEPGFCYAVASKSSRPISIRRMNELIRDIIVFYRENDQPVVDVSMPAGQRITNGVVQLVITEGEVGEVKFEGNCRFDDCTLSLGLCNGSGDAIYESALMEDLRWLNRNPYRDVSIRLRAGDAKGATDLVYDVEERTPISGYIGYEDSGARVTGIERTIYGFHLGNVFRKGHQFGYQMTASSNFNSLLAHSCVYSFDLANRDQVQIFGSYAELSADITGAPLALSGRAWQVSGRYNHELYPGACCPRDRLVRNLTYGVDFKSTNTNLEFGGVNVFGSTAHILQLMLGYNARRQTWWGNWGWGAEVFHGLDGFSPGNNDAALNALRAGAEAEYAYTRLSYHNRINLPNCWALVNRVTGQLADGNLPPSEQLGFGGYDSIRGYDMRQVNGDSGVLVNMELHAAPLHFGSCNESKLETLAFLDYGDARNHSPLAGEDPSVDLSSVGAGARYSFNNNFLLRADYGWRLNEVTGATRRERVHVGMVIRR